MSGIEVQIIDLNLFSGSTDPFRSAIGGFWTTYSSSEGSTLLFEDFDDTSPSIGYFDELKSRASNSDYIEVIDSSSILPNKRFPVRVYGNADYVKDDSFWKTIFVGGTFGGYNYRALYNEDLFEYHYASASVPYPKLSSSLLPTQIVDEIQISYDYYHYLPKYQRYSDDLESELLMPNFYILNDVSTYSYESASALYDTKLLQYVTLEDTYEDIEYIFDINADALPADNDFTFSEMRNQASRGQYTHLITTYLTSAFVQRPLSSSTTTWVQNKFKNVLIDSDAIEKLYNVDIVTSTSNLFPYYTKASFPNGNFSDFSNSIIDNNFSSKFIKTLYETFSDQIDSLIPATSSFAINQNYLSGTTDESYSEIKETANIPLRSIDYIPFLFHCRDHYSSSAAGCVFVGENNIYRNSITKGGNGAYRYLNTANSIGVLNDTITYLSNSANFDIDELSDIYGNNECHIETLAYRIEKIGGPPKGLTQTQDALQNYWIMNSELEEFNFFDTQVKYDTQYTYNVYEYMLIVGFKYKFTDLGLTRQLSCEDSHGRYGLEFYNPFSTDEEVVDKKYTSGDYFESQNELATDAQTFSYSKYLADFYLNYEPSVKIIEVPIFSKSFKITDYVPNMLSIQPYQLIDNSQTIGYNFKYGTYAYSTHPSSITEEDAEAKENYLYANDLLETDTLPFPTISQARYIEVYRLSEKPTAMTDFEGNLLSTIDLIQDQSKYTYTVSSFENRIRTNQKYYYLFRVLNEQNVAGHLSVIYESELVNDGGYLYSVFNVIHEEELDEKTFINPSKTFKKLLQLKPNYSQVELDTTGLDYNQEASSQLTNLNIGTTDDLIWGKTFKIRLTSNKTGKKIDLNITYNLSSEY